MQEDVTTWIVTADGRRAEVHEERVRGGRLHPLAEQALSMSSEDRIAAHTHGATVHASHGDARHGAGERDPAEAAERRFLKRVGEMLEVAAVAGRFERLILMAAPHALGVLRQALGPHATARVDLSEPHDRLQLAEPDLRQALRAARIRA